jgi:hypothetical protein
MKVAIAFGLCFFTTQVFAQAAAFPPPPPKVSPAIGVIDMHVHSYPDVFGAMKREGISDADIDLMMRKTPARLLGLSS